MPFFQKGDVRIRYEETGSGFPLLVTPGGGLNSRVSNWPTAWPRGAALTKDIERLGVETSDPPEIPMPSVRSKS